MCLLVSTVSFDGVVSDVVTVSVVAVLAFWTLRRLVRLCQLLMVAVTGYRWVIRVILIRTVETKTTVHIQLVVVKAF